MAQCSHSGTLVVPTSGSPACLACFADVLQDSSSLVTHRSHAISELTRLLTQDDEFRDGLLRFHPHFLVSPLSEALSLCKDEDLAKSTVELVMVLTRSGGNGVLLTDFILHLSMHLCNRVIAWSRGQCYMIHALGLLLDLHSKCNASVPDALRCQESFVPNLVAALQLPSDDIKGEALFLLYKLCSLDRGTDQLAGFSSKIIYLTVDALLKTENNELRMNCIALLAVLARCSVFDLSSTTQNDCVSVEAFAEAIKGSLLSTDVQVQLASLQLICNLCPPEEYMLKEINILVEEGVADYIFEVLRVSENLSSLSVGAIRTLSILSAARSVFTQRLVFGIDAVLRVLEHSVEAELNPAQVDALLLLGDGLSDYPGVINSAKAERIFTLLAKVLRQHANSVEDSSALGAGPNLISGTYTAACMALGSLLKVPCLSTIDSASERVAAVVSDTLTCISQTTFLESDAVRYSVCLLQEAFVFAEKIGEKLLELLDLFDRRLLPVLPDKAESLEDEGTLSAIVCFMTEIMRRTVPLSAALSFARKMAEDKWLTLVFASTSRFRSQGFKEDVMDFVATMVDLLEPGNGDVVRAAMPNFPTDPSDWLHLLEQTGTSNPDIVISHCTILIIVYISYLHNDRLLEVEHILPSLENFIMFRAGILADNSIYSKQFRQLLSLYVVLKQESASSSAEAEDLLVSVVANDAWKGLISPTTSPLVRSWIFSKKRLRPLCMEQLRLLLVSSSPSELDVICNIVEDASGAAVLVSLLNRAVSHNASDDLETVARGLKNALTLSDRSPISRNLHIHGIAAVLRRWYVLRGSKANAVVLQTVLEVISQLLISLTPDTISDAGSWCDIANQTVYLFISRANYGLDGSLTTSIVILLCLFAYKSSEMNALSEMSKTIYMNKQLCSVLNTWIVKSISEGKLLQPSMRSEDEQFLCLCLLFHLLGLQWERKSISSRYAESTSGWRTSRRVSEILETSVSSEHLCQILQHGSGPLRVLSSCCLLQNVLRLVNPADATTAAALPVHSLKAMLLLLQSSMLDEHQMVRIAASASLHSLLTSNPQFFSSEYRREVQCSPWYCFLVKEMIRSLSSPESDGPCEWQAKLVVAFLHVSPVPSWLPLVLDAPSIMALVANVSVDNVSYWKTCLFLKLLQLRWLNQEHIQPLCEHFQCYRKAAYAKAHNISKEEKIDMPMPNAWPGTLKILCSLVVLQSIAKTETSSALAGKLDEFLKESHC